MKKEKHNKYAESRFSNYRMYIKTYGLFYVIRYGMHKLFPSLMGFIFTRFTDRPFFDYDNKKLQVFFSKYRTTWANERMIEIPIFKYLSDKYKDKEVLEVGNVLSHYIDIEYDILDKYEKGENIINEDIIDYSPDKLYDIIFSISTFEHIGYDEDVLDDRKIFDVINHLKSLLNPGGKIVFSIPIDYNPYLDKHILEGRLQIDDKLYLKRMKKYNLWEYVDEDEAMQSRYGKPFYCASAILIGTING